MTVVPPHFSFLWREHNVFPVTIPPPTTLDALVAIHSPFTTMTTSLQVFMTCVTVLYIKFVVATGIQAIKTFDAGGRPPEDRNLALAQGRRQQTYGLHTGDEDETLKKAKQVELRWKRIIMNDLESIPLALIVFGAGILCNANEVVHSIVMLLYTIVRCGHTVAYAYEIQPHRAMCWRIGVVSILIAAINGMVGAFRL